MHVDVNKLKNIFFLCVWLINPYILEKLVRIYVKACSVALDPRKSGSYAFFHHISQLTGEIYLHD